MVRKKRENRHIVLSHEAYMRLKKFSANFDLPMKNVVEWFIYSIIDENGLPQLEEVIIVLEELMPEKVREVLKQTEKEEQPT